MKKQLNLEKYSNIPAEYKEFYSHIRSLSFLERPNYKYLLELFHCEESEIRFEDLKQSGKTLLTVEKSEKKVSSSTNHYEESDKVDDISEKCEIDLKRLNQKIADEGVRKKVD